MQNLDNNKGGRNGARVSRGDISKPLPANPPGRASLDLGKSPRASADLVDLVSSESEDVLVPHNYDRAWYEMLSSLHGALKHTRYSVSGRMGMTVWGCANGAKTGLSIVCPIESREAVKIWCISTSGRFSITEAEPDILSFQSPGAPSRTWRVRVRWLREAAFEAMPKVEMALRYDDGNPYAGEQVAEVNVLTLPALLDNCASAWVVEHARVRQDGLAESSRLRGIEDDIFSILERVMDLNFSEEGAGPLTQHKCRHVARPNFWAPFTEAHPDSPAMFALCGLPIPPPVTTTTQPAPHAGMVYPEDHRFSNPRPAPAVPPKDKGRDLTANVKPKPEPKPEPPRRVSFMGLFSSSARKEAKAAKTERERRHSEDARKLEEQVRRGARQLDDRESERRRRLREQEAGRKGKENETRPREERSNHRLKEMPSRRMDDRDGDRRRDSSPRSSRSSSSRRPHSTSSSARDGTKVSSFDPSALERSASGNGRIPRRGHFADLFIVDDGETL